MGLISNGGYFATKHSTLKGSSVLVIKWYLELRDRIKFNIDSYLIENYFSWSNFW